MPSATEAVVENGSGHCCGNGAASYGPLDSMRDPREKFLYAICLQSPTVEKTKPGYLATIDVDPESPTYCQVISRLYSSSPNDELHHFGWNSCVSCKDPSVKRRFIVMPGVVTGNIHIIDTTNQAQPTMHKVIPGREIEEKYDITGPHTVHCVPSGDVMISYMGDAKQNAKGSFLLLDGRTFEPKGLWNKNDRPVMGYDFWYQPRWNVLASSEWSAPSAYLKGYVDPADIENKLYGHHIHFWNWTTGALINSIPLGETYPSVPLELRFLHNPDSSEGFIGVELESSIYRFFRDDSGKWSAEKVIQIPPKKVENYFFPEMTSLIPDILISMDDKWLYVSNIAFGEMRQYDISDTKHPRLNSTVCVGGLVCKDSKVKVTADTELHEPYDRPSIKGKLLKGGPVMFQLSRDGKRLYLTYSVLTPWDKTFFPEATKEGSGIIMLDCSENGMKINEDFYVDLSNEPDGPARAHEVRYPGGDCTSDIFV